MNNWCFIVPYRNREFHLSIFSIYYKVLFPDVPIYIIEQGDDKEFNRAKLLNVGFKEFGKDYDYCAYHDIDMLGVRGGVNYSYPNVPTHLATHCSQFGYKMPYPNYFGGVTLINKEDFIKVNGFSNDIWGYGLDDDEMSKNILLSGLVIHRRECWYESLFHERKVDVDSYNKNLQQVNKGRAQDDGLTHCEYKINGITKDTNYMKLTVTL